MIAKILVLLITIALCSCATKSTKKQTYTDVDSITKESFIAPKTVNYNTRKDSLVKVDSELSDATNSESLYRAYLLDGDHSSATQMDELSKLCYEREFKRAYELAKSIQRTYAKNPIYWNQLGSCFLMEGHRKKALLFYNLALSYRSNYSPTLNNLGVMYSMEKDYSRAQISFEKAIRANQFSRTPRLNLSNLYLSFGLYQNAKKHLSTLESLSSTDVDVLNLSAISALMQQSVKKALGYYSRIPSNVYSKPKYGINYSLALYSDGQKDEARDVFNDISPKGLGVWKYQYKEVRKLIGAK